MESGDEVKLTKERPRIWKSEASTMWCPNIYGLRRWSRYSWWTRGFLLSIMWEPRTKESQKLEEKCPRRRTYTPVFLGVIKTVHKSPLNLVTCSSPLILVKTALVWRRGWFKRTWKGNEWAIEVVSSCNFQWVLLWNNGDTWSREWKSGEVQEELVIYSNHSAISAEHEWHSLGTCGQGRGKG